MTKPKMIEYRAKVPPWMADTVRHLGEAMGISQAEIVRSALLDWIAKAPPWALPQRGPQWGPDQKTPLEGGLIFDPPAYEAPLEGGPQWGPTPPPYPPLSKERRSSSDQSGAPLQRECPVDLAAFTAELTETVNRAAGTRLRPDDPHAHRAVFNRLTGHELADSDAGKATPEQVRAVVEHCARTWSKGWSIHAFVGTPKFWGYLGQIGAAPKTTPIPAQSDADRRWEAARGLGATRREWIGHPVGYRYFDGDREIVIPEEHKG